MKITNQIILFTVIAFTVLAVSIISYSSRWNINSFEDGEKIANEGLNNKDVMSWNKSINDLLIKNGPNVSSPLAVYIISFSKKDSIGKKNLEILIKAVNYDRLNEYDRNIITHSKGELQLPVDIRTKIQTKLDELPLDLSICDTYDAIDQLESSFEKNQFLIEQFDFQNKKNLKLFTKRKQEIQYVACKIFQKQYPTYESIPAHSIESDWFNETSFSDYYVSVLEAYLAKKTFSDLDDEYRNKIYFGIVPDNLHSKVEIRVIRAMRNKFKVMITSEIFEQGLLHYYEYVYNPIDKDAVKVMENDGFETECIKILFSKTTTQKDIEYCQELIQNIESKATQEMLGRIIVKTP